MRSSKTARENRHEIQTAEPAMKVEEACARPLAKIPRTDGQRDDPATDVDQEHGIALKDHRKQLWPRRDFGTPIDVASGGDHDEGATSGRDRSPVW